MKRFLTVVLVVVIFFSIAAVFCSCGQEAGVNSFESTVAPANQETEDLLNGEMVRILCNSNRNYYYYYNSVTHIVYQEGYAGVNFKTFIPMVSGNGYYYRYIDLGNGTFKIEEIINN